MNQILRKSFSLSSNYLTRNVVFSPQAFRFLSDEKKTFNGDIVKDDNPMKIKETIETNEDNYFANVKKSFDNLQKSRDGESIEEKRSRLMYQSRKRGISENGLLLGNFSAEYLPKMSAKQLNEYDKIINGLHNEWDLYYWLTNTVPTPSEFSSMETLQLMKKFCLNTNKQSRIVQPDINFAK